jgi:hypothetical protein
MNYILTHKNIFNMSYDWVKENIISTDLGT